ncbi:MAG: hypothetical protein RIS54_1480 [Verrucomicrobiota bacterium]
MNRLPSRLTCCSLLAGLLLGGCVTTDPRAALLKPAAELRVNARGEIADTGFDASDLVVACSNIQQGVGLVPDIAYRGRLVRIAVEAVSNDTPFALPMDGFDAALRGQLDYRAGPAWKFERAKAAEPDYFLAGRLQHLRPVGSSNHVTLLYTFRLVDARNTEIVMQGTAELKNRALPPPTS